MFSKLESSSKTKNLALALVGINIAHRRFPLGGINRKDTYESIGYPQNVEQVRILGFFREACKKNDPVAVGLILNSRALQGAKCGDIVAVVLHDLKRLTDTAVECVNLDNHQMIVIGRDPSSNPNDIDTWGENAVICDPWARKFYEANCFRLEQRLGEKIPIVNSINPKNGLVTSIEEEEYLTGSPQIGFELFSP